jgi:Lon protease-like protein
MATRGTERFRVVDGIESDTLFTEALVEPWPDLESDEVSRLTARRFRTAELFHEAAVHTGRMPDAIPRIDTGRDVSWQVAQAFQIEEPWRQSLLEIRSEIHRLDAIDRLLNKVIDYEG